MLSESILGNPHVDVMFANGVHLMLTSLMLVASILILDITLIQHKLDIN